MDSLSCLFTYIFLLTILYKIIVENLFNILDLLPRSCEMIKNSPFLKDPSHQRPPSHQARFQIYSEIKMLNVPIKRGHSLVRPFLYCIGGGYIRGRLMYSVHARTPLLQNWIQRWSYTNGPLSYIWHRHTPWRLITNTDRFVLSEKRVENRQSTNLCKINLSQYLQKVAEG